MKRIGAAFLITILMLSSAPLLFHAVPVSTSTEIQPAGGTQISVSGSSSTISWHWDCPGDDYVQGVAISADGSYVVARTEGDKIYLFNKSSSTPVWEYSAGTVFSVDISDNGSYIVVGGDGVLLFGSSDNTPIWENDYSYGQVISSVSISSDGSYIAAAVRYTKVLLFSRDNSAPIMTYDDLDAPSTVSISADGQNIAVGTSNGDESRIYLLDRDSSVMMWSSLVYHNVTDVAISTDGSYIVADAHSAYLFSSDDNRPIWTFIMSQNYGVDSVAISADGSRVAIGDIDCVYELTNSDNTPLWDYVLPRYRGESVAISYDGRYVGGFAFDHVYMFSEEGGGNPFEDYSVPYYGHVLAMSQAADYVACDDGEGITFREVELPGKIFTILAVSPSTFNVGSENSITLTATLTSQGSPMAGRTITWSATAGNLSPTNGTTDSSGQVSVTYTAPSITSYASVTVTASFAGAGNYEESSYDSIGTIIPAGASSTLITSEYNGFFLHNVNAITNTYQVVVPSENVSGVVFQMGGETLTDNTAPYEATYNMGSVGVNPTLNVTVHFTNGATISDSVSPTILETPELLSQILNVFNAADQVNVSKKANGCWNMHVSGEVSLAAVTRYITGSPIPFLGNGNYGLPFSKWTLSFMIASDDYNNWINFGSVGLSLDDAEFMNFGGLSFNANLSGGFTVRPDGRDEITSPTMVIKIRGDVSWDFEFYPIMVGPVPVRVSITPQFGADLDMSLGFENPIVVNDVSGDIHGGVDISAGVDIIVAGIGFYGTIDVFVYFTAAPSFNFKKVTIAGEGGIYVRGLFWRYRRSLIRGSWSSNPGTSLSPQSENEWELDERDYLGPDYSTFAWTAGNHEGALVENIYPNPQPSIAVAEDGSMVAAWTYDDPSKELLQALEIAYSIYNPQLGTWTTPATITSDHLFDSNPKLAYLGNNQVLAVWQRVPYQLENTILPFSCVENIELAYSILDLNTSVWSTPQLITSNSTYEAPSALVSCGGKTWLIYLRDSDSDIFTLDNQTIVAAEWTGAGWSEEETIASGISVVGNPCLSLAGANDGILTFARDMDDNLLTVTDREIFYLRYNGSWGTATRLTNDNIWATSPSAGRANNQWYLSWIEMKSTENNKYTTSVCFGELANGQFTKDNSLFENQGVTGQSILGEIQNKLYLLYQVGAKGTPKLIRYDGSTWENVDNFQWSPTDENAFTSQLSISISGNHLGTIGVTAVQADEGQISTSLHASTFSLYPEAQEVAETPWVLIGGIIAALVAIGIIVAVIFSRRKRTISAGKQR